MFNNSYLEEKEGKKGNKNVIKKKKKGKKSQDKKKSRQHRIESMHRRIISLRLFSKEERSTKIKNMP